MAAKLLRRWGIAVLVLTALALLAACGDDDDDASAGAAEDRLRVVTTTVQITALAREVGGELIDLHGVVPAGADAHEFEPTASDLAAIEDAQLILRHGIELDDWLDGTLSAARSAAVSVVTAGITLEKGEAHDHGEEEHEEGDEHEDDEEHEGEEHEGEEHEEDEHEEGEEHEDGEEVDDPHIWHDPDLAKIMVENIAAALAAADPDNRDAYEANSAAYQATLDETKQQVQAIIDKIPEANRKLVTNHDAFGYFARAFGLEVVGAVIPSTSTEAEPSAADTAALLDTIEHEGVKAIFAESSVNPGLARTLASDAGIAIVDDLYGDSLGEDGSGAESVHGMLLANARKIADALK